MRPSAATAPSPKQQSVGRAARFWLWVQAVTFRAAPSVAAVGGVRTCRLGGDVGDRRRRDERTNRWLGPSTGGWLRHYDSRIAHPSTRESGCSCQAGTGLMGGARASRRKGAVSRQRSSRPVQRRRTCRHRWVLSTCEVPGALASRPRIGPPRSEHIRRSRNRGQRGPAARRCYWLPIPSNLRNFSHPRRLIGVCEQHFVLHCFWRSRRRYR